MWTLGWVDRSWEVGRGTMACCGPRGCVDSRVGRFHTFRMTIFAVFYKQYYRDSTCKSTHPTVLYLFSCTVGQLKDELVFVNNVARSFCNIKCLAIRAKQQGWAPGSFPFGTFRSFPLF